MWSFLSRVGLHIWSVTWPLASRGTHPVVGFNFILFKSFHLIQIPFRWAWPRQAVHSQNQAIAGFKTSSPCLNSMASSLVRLVGSNSSSWGWCLKTMKVYHDSRKYRHGVPYPRLPIVFWSSYEIFMKPESCARVYSDLASMWNMYQGCGWEAEGARNLLHASWHGQGHSCLSGEYTRVLDHL